MISEWNETEARETYAAIVNRYNEIASKDAELLKLQRAIARPSFEDAYNYAQRAGIDIGKALSEIFGGMADGSVVMDARFADATVGRVVRNAGNKVSTIFARCQNAINQNAGVGIKSIPVLLDTDRIDGLITFISTNPIESVLETLTDKIVNFCNHTVDENVKKGSEFNAEAGLVTEVTRTVENGELSGGRKCAFCIGLAGTYKYPFPKDIFRRHENCQCLIEEKMTGRMRKK